jgi:FAD:protein FMN transferase
VKEPPAASESRAAAVAANSGTRAAVWLFLFPICLVGTGRAAQPGNTREYRYLMGTSVEVNVFDGEGGPAIDEAFAAMAEVDRLMSNYRDDSELALINHTAASRPVPVSDPMFSVLSAASDVSVRSGGAFDVTVGPLVRLWGFHDKQPHVPTSPELAAVRPLVGYRNIVLDRQQRTVRFVRPGIEVDLGGIAKGFAVEIAAGVLRRHGLSGFIDAGGNQYLRGTPPGKRLWSIGVKDPDDPRRVLGAIDTEETSVSTSADYANFLTWNGRTYGHILDPHTLAPSDKALSVTILSRDGTLADALSKAVFVLGPKMGLALVESFPGTTALIAYRDRDGGIATTMSAPLRSRFHPSVERH